MKKSILLLAIISLPILSYGQVSWGLSGGPNLSSMSVDLRDLSTFKINPKFGFNVNLITDINLTYSLALSSGFSFTQKGFKHTLYDENGPSISAEMVSQMNYLEIPVYIKVHTNLTKVNFFYGVGPYFSYGINGKVTTKTFDPESNYTEDILWNKAPSDENSLPSTYGYTKIKRFDVGIGSLVGIKYKQLFFTLDYKFGFKNIMWEYALDEKMSNSCLSLSVGYILNDLLK
jgi:hypothetical protein